MLNIVLYWGVNATFFIFHVKPSWTIFFMIYHRSGYRNEKKPFPCLLSIQIKIDQAESPIIAGRRETSRVLMTY